MPKFEISTISSLSVTQIDLNLYYQFYSVQLIGHIDTGRLITSATLKLFNYW